jgi:hypothetical protein
MNLGVLVVKVLYPMTQAALLKIISQLEVLETEELQKLSQAIKVRLSTVAESDKLAGFYSSLLTSGLVIHIKPIYSQQQPRLSLIEIQGNPISQTIIEDRR